MNEETQPQTFTGQNPNPTLNAQDFPTPVSPEVPQRPHVTETPQKSIRTYESDVADVLAHKNISTTTIALAEKKKNTGEERIGDTTNPVEDHSQAIKKTLIALASLVLIAGGVGGAYYFYSISPLAQTSKPVPQVVAPSSVVPANKQVSISIDSMNPTKIVAAIRKEAAKKQENNTIKEIILVQTTNGQKVRVSGPTIAGLMDVNAPDILLRALSNDWMIGVYTDSQGSNNFFVIATVNYFQNAFAGMLQWENVMADDLKLYLSEDSLADIAAVKEKVASISNTNVLQNIEQILPEADNMSVDATGSTTNSYPASTTVSSTTSDYRPNPQYTVLQGTFTDRIIHNKDVREFVTSQGVLFLYSFIDNTKLIFTGKESTLNEVLNRLEQKTFVR